MKTQRPLPNGKPAVTQHTESVADVTKSAIDRSNRSQPMKTSTDDADTADLFTEISRGIDKWLWFVEAHSQASK